MQTNNYIGIAENSGFISLEYSEIVLFLCSGLVPSYIIFLSTFSYESIMCTHFCQIRKQHPDPELYLNGTQFPIIGEAKFIGLLFDSKLAFIPHINSLKSRCTKRLGVACCAVVVVVRLPRPMEGNVRDGLKVNSISVCEEENVEFITVELPGVVHSLYKPPPEPFLRPPLGQRIKPHIVIGDFNNHSTLWGYTTTDSDGEAVEQ